MQIRHSTRTAIVMPVGPGVANSLDTLQSIECYCLEPHDVLIIDDCTQDGTYQALLASKLPNLKILRNSRPFGWANLVQTLATGYRCVLDTTKCDLILKLDQDALMIGSDILSEAMAFAQANPTVGLFGVYAHDYDRPRSFGMHTRRIGREMHWMRRLVGLTPSWAELLRLAQANGYQLGDNVFGGAYFVTRACLEGMHRLGALDVPSLSRTQLAEDVYFSMAAVAAGFQLGHFGAPEGPLCLEWQGLPHPASELLTSGYKIVHSVDKGKNTDRQANKGKTAREVFREARALTEHV